MQAKTARPGKTAKPRRKLTRDERRQIDAVVRQAKGDGKTHTVQDSIPFRNMFPDRKSTRLNSSHWKQSRMPSSA